ncbi:MAG: Ig-like domain-containing protein [Clostridia bacterium]
MNKTLRSALVLVLVLLTVAQLALPVTAFAAQGQAIISLKRATINMAQDRTLELTARVTPSSAKDDVVWRSGNTSIATVSDGTVTARRVGRVKIGVRVPGGKWSICTVTIKNTGSGDSGGGGSARPASLVLSSTAEEMAVGQKLTLSATIKPTSANQAVRWQTNNASIVSVSQDGVVTARRPGRALVRATALGNSRLKRSVRITVSASNPPTSIALSPDTDQMNVGNTLRLIATVSPSGATDAVTWSSSSSAVATVSKTGVVTAKREGRAVIRATSTVNDRVRATRTITVSDPGKVTSIKIDQTDMYLNKGSATQLTYTILPENNKAQVTWSSSDTQVAAVTTTGKVAGRDSGTATITVRAGNKSDNIEVRVLTSEREEDLPDTYVASASQVSGNRRKINAIFRSAMEELEMNVVKKDITTSERASRKAILQRGFVMYDVAWKSTSNVAYWNPKSGNSYIADRIYFGMPYTQNNRNFNLEKWLGVLRPSKSGDVYTVSGMPNVSYPGNDCSSFVSISQYGANSGLSDLNTDALYTSTGYTTIPDGFNRMVPGDILVKHGHTAMFLYYVTPDRIMVIEQGGGMEPNTVACHIKSVNGVYRPQGYRVRRKAGFAN